MDKEIFDECHKHYMSNFKLGETWASLAQKFAYPSGENIRNAFKRTRNFLGIPSKLEISQAENIEKAKEIDCKELQRKMNPKHNAKVLLLDIETSPILAFIWGLYNQDQISTEAVVKDWFVFTWSAKWIFDPEILHDSITAEEAKKQDDCRVVENIWKLLDEADIVIGHNIAKFDTKKLNTRFLYHGFPPPSAFQMVDTLEVARNVFCFSSNKLDYINKYLGLPQKQDVDFSVWKKCYEGDANALKKLDEYCGNDVAILEDLYLRLRPYIKGHPNLNLWSEEKVSVCPNCGSSNLERNTKEYYTSTGRYASFKCNHCGANGRERKSNIPKEKSAVIIRN